MSNFLTTVVDAGKQAVQQYVLQPRVVDAPNATSPYFGTPPILVASPEPGSVWYSGLEKIKDDLLTQLKGAAKDTVRAVAGGAAQAIQDTPEYRREKATLGLTLLGVGAIGVIALAVAMKGR